MFENIGKKIKKLAQFYTGIGIVVSIILGIITATIDPEMGLFGLILVIVGSIASWLSSLVLYGFGQLVDNTDKIVTNLLYGFGKLTDNTDKIVSKIEE